MIVEDSAATPPEMSLASAIMNPHRSRATAGRGFPRLTQLRLLLREPGGWRRCASFRRGRCGRDQASKVDAVDDDAGTAGGIGDRCIMSRMRPYFMSASVRRKPSDSSRMPFLPGSCSMPRDHVLDRAERAGREDLLLQRLEALVELGRSERRDPSHHRPADTVGGGVQGAAVGGELLKGAHARGRAQDGDQVCRAASARR